MIAPEIFALKQRQPWRQGVSRIARCAFAAVSIFGEAARGIPHLGATLA
jgi:hypothetical protein